MLELKVTITAPELTDAINALAQSIGKLAVPQLNQTTESSIAPTEAPTTAVPATVGVAPTETQAVPVDPTEDAAPTESPPSVAPTDAAAPTETLSPAPQYTKEALMIAAGALVDNDKTQELVDMLAAFGVKAMVQLNESQFDAVAAAMRKMGADI